MADSQGTGGGLDREIDKVLVALKKGAQLLKYGRKGKPKFCPFRLSSDESSLIWLSSSKEKVLKLASVSKIISGQRTVVFQRYLRPEKDYLSFSLIYNNGKRSLDLICKDKAEAEIWFAGLRALVASGHSGRSKIDGWSEGGIYFDASRELTSSSLSGSSISTIADSFPDGCIDSDNLSKCSSEKNASLERLDLKNMHTKGASSDVFRVSISSAPSTSSHGSAQDECDSLGDVYIWGEVICEVTEKKGTEKCFAPSAGRADVLLPKPLESNMILDVHQVACGVRHAALVSRQGEVFTWGEESGGRLGHGVRTDVIHPRLVESLATNTIEFVACGEFHTCAVTGNGELYTWGDGTHNAGLLGHGTCISHWVPKRVAGPLEGLQVSYVSCGSWHTALIATTGQLFTFGDGAFGVLGHGNRENVMHPREVESLMGLKTTAVSCGVWHTAAVVEVIGPQSSASVLSGKLFTWGDGDKYRLGHGDKEPRLLPTCVPSLIDHNFLEVACGHSLTVGLTSAGRVVTMGSNIYGQLGNPNSDGKLPCFVADSLGSASVVEIATGSYHVMVLTSRNEVYTWGKGANGRLGHGDLEDRKTPALVEVLKDRQVKHISCGSNFSAAICHHKWVSGAEQSQCYSCRQAFGFTRKRHNCYNCGFVHCHSCSSRKALRAALSLNPAKPHRVCDSCYTKLSKVSEGSSMNNKKTSAPRISGESKDQFDKIDAKPSATVTLDPGKYFDLKSGKAGRKNDLSSLAWAPQVSASLHLNDVVLPRLTEPSISKARVVSQSHSVSNSRAVSPFSRKSSPLRSATPVPTISGLSFSKNGGDDLRKTNEALNQELKKLQSQVESLRQRCQRQDLELQKSVQKVQEAMTLAAEESSKSKAAKEVIKSLTAQLKEMAERLPNKAYDANDIRPAYLPNGTANIIQHSSFAGEIPRVSENSNLQLPSATNAFLANKMPNETMTSSDVTEDNDMESTENMKLAHVNEREQNSRIQHYSNGGSLASMSRTNSANDRDSDHVPVENDFKHKSSFSTTNNQVAGEWIEQYEPGVYITLIALPDGARDLKRVRFSRRRFGEQQAEAWWSINRDKVYSRYNIQASNNANSG